MKNKKIPKRKGWEKQRLEAKLRKAKERVRQWVLGVEVEWPDHEADLENSEKTGKWQKTSDTISS